MMLAFSSFSDAHFHIVQCGTLPSFSVPYYAVTCAHDREEFLTQRSLISAYRGIKNVQILGAFGMHPQIPLVQNADFMENLLKEKNIQAIGEAGFDLFTKELKGGIVQQEEAWNIEVELAAAYNVPLIVHCRKSLDRMFRDSKKLTKVRAVVFHSFEGSPADARSLLRHNINAYYSFGKPLINGDKSAAACVKELDKDRLLMETDAPYQTLKGEKETSVCEIERVYKTAFTMRNGENLNQSAENFSAEILANFKAAYGIA
jgi:TatD DNase family protein